MNKGLSGDLLLCICPQVLNEFYAVITNPKRVTNPVSHEEAVVELEKYIRAKNILKIYPGDDILDITLDLMKKYKVREQEIFDLQLVATMLSSKVTSLYTYNKEDFSKFRGIEILLP